MSVDYDEVENPKSFVRGLVLLGIFSLTLLLPETWQEEVQPLMLPSVAGTGLTCGTPACPLAGAERKKGGERALVLAW